MLWFSSTTQRGDLPTLTIDIGSGSVAIAILNTGADEETTNDLIWSHREYILIRDQEAVKRNLQEIKTALINAFLVFGSDGVAALASAGRKNRIGDVIVCISAPWSHTATKEVHYSNAKKFLLSESLIDELTDTANKKIITDIESLEVFADIDLRVLDTKTIQLSANGYPLSVTQKSQATDVTLTQLISLASTSLLEQVEDNLNKISPRSTLDHHSFIAVLYFVLKQDLPQKNYCLVDVTSEATEIAIVRDGVLSYCTHCPVGSNTLARSIATATKTPFDEAQHYLKSKETVTSAVAEKFTNYEETLTELFSETGDTLAIPKKIFLHCDRRLESFFTKRLAAAATTASTLEHTVTTVASTLPKSETDAETNDTALRVIKLYIEQLRANEE